jgi:hypothetical protein
LQGRLGQRVWKTFGLHIHRQIHQAGARPAFESQVKSFFEHRRQLFRP